MTEETTGEDERGPVALAAEVLAVPIGMMLRLASAGPAGERPLWIRAAVVASFLPLIAVYEALAVPLVAGSLLLVSLLLAPVVLIAAVLSLAAAATRAAGPASEQVPRPGDVPASHAVEPARV